MRKVSVCIRNCLSRCRRHDPESIRWEDSFLSYAGVGGAPPTRQNRRRDRAAFGKMCSRLIAEGRPGPREAQDDHRSISLPKSSFVGCEFKLDHETLPSFVVVIGSRQI